MAHEHGPRRQQLRVPVLAPEVEQKRPAGEGEQHADADVHVQRLVGQELVHDGAFGGERAGVVLGLHGGEFVVCERGAVVSRWAGDAPRRVRRWPEFVGLFEHDLAFGVCGGLRGRMAAGRADVGGRWYGASRAKREASEWD